MLAVSSCLLATHLHCPRPSAAPVTLRELVKVGKKREPMKTPIRDEVEFEALLAGGNTVRLMSAANKPLQGIRNWQDAVAASHRDDGAWLELISIAAPYDDDSSLWAGINNRATGMESQTNHAMVHDPELRRKYAPLRLLNGGRGVKFFLKNPKRVILEVDGLAVNSTVVLANECKSALDTLHISGVPVSDDAADGGVLQRAADLEKVLASTDVFCSEPPEVMEACAGKKVIPVVSGIVIGAEAGALRRSLGIELLQPQGVGGAYTVPLVLQ